ncbi:MAG: fused response regulator/phosphatase [Rhodospirillales bacterium]|nr:fused response regulator/phosphatase [Rhodospirillales bacterium]
MDVYQQIKDSLNSSTLLIVDDDEMIRHYLAAYLEQAGFTNIVFAENGVEALEKISQHRPACVVLDIHMPVMDGNAVLQRIRGQEETKSLPVLVVTSHDSRDERNNILRAGATNLISKPIEGDVLVERVTNMIERELLFGQLAEFHARLSTELSYAAEMQLDLLPTAADCSAIETRYGVGLANHSRPSSELGGDSWALQVIDDDRFGIMIVDFSGHGVSAALNTFRLHTVINRIGFVGGSPARYIESINEEIADVMPVGQYCTILCAVVDIKADTLTYSGAAAPSPLIGRNDGSTIVVGDGSGLPVGIRRHSTYEDHVVDFPAGSFLFLYSDALFETEMGNGAVLETTGVASLVERCKNADASASLNQLLAVFYEDAPEPLPDDLTALWMSR